MGVLTVRRRVDGDAAHFISEELARHGASVLEIGFEADPYVRDTIRVIPDDEELAFEQQILDTERAYEAVRRAYAGGVSNRWRPFLEYLARHADQWVRVPDIARELDCTPQQVVGMLGAAERRCGQEPPYEKKGPTGRRQFRMTKLHSAWILQFAAEAKP